MASVVDDQYSRAFENHNSIRASFRTHKDSSEQDLLDTLKLAAKQQRRVRKAQPWQRNYTDIGGGPKADPKQTMFTTYRNRKFNLASILHIKKSGTESEKQPIDAFPPYDKRWVSAPFESLGDSLGPAIRLPLSTNSHSRTESWLSGTTYTPSLADDDRFRIIAAPCDNAQIFEAVSKTGKLTEEPPLREQKKTKKKQLKDFDTAVKQERKKIKAGLKPRKSASSWVIPASEVSSPVSYTPVSGFSDEARARSYCSPGVASVGGLCELPAYSKEPTPSSMPMHPVYIRSSGTTGSVASPPTLGDFSDESHLRAYLNPEVTTRGGLCELPAYSKKPLHSIVTRIKGEDLAPVAGAARPISPWRRNHNLCDIPEERSDHSGRIRDTGELMAAPSVDMALAIVNDQGSSSEIHGDVSKPTTEEQCAPSTQIDDVMSPVATGSPVVSPDHTLTEPPWPGERISQKRDTNGLAGANNVSDKFNAMPASSPGERCQRLRNVTAGDYIDSIHETRRMTNPATPRKRVVGSQEVMGLEGATTSYTKVPPIEEDLHAPGEPHIRVMSSWSSETPVSPVSGILDLGLDALESVSGLGYSISRPTHTHNLSSMSSDLSQLSLTIQDESSGVSKKSGLGYLTSQDLAQNIITTIPETVENTEKSIKRPPQIVKTNAGHQVHDPRMQEYQRPKQTPLTFTATQAPPKHSGAYQHISRFSPAKVDMVLTPDPCREIGSDGTDTAAQLNAWMIAVIKRRQQRGESENDIMPSARVDTVATDRLSAMVDRERSDVFEGSNSSPLEKHELVQISNLHGTNPLDNTTQSSAISNAPKAANCSRTEELPSTEAVDMESPLGVPESGLNLTQHVSNLQQAIDSQSLEPVGAVAKQKAKTSHAMLDAYHLSAIDFAPKKRESTSEKDHIAFRESDTSLRRREISLLERETSLQYRELSLREQNVSLREQLLSSREQSMLLREQTFHLRREMLSSDITGLVSEHQGSLAPSSPEHIPSRKPKIALNSPEPNSTTSLAKLVNGATTLTRMDELSMTPNDTESALQEQTSPKSRRGAIGTQVPLHSSSNFLPEKAEAGLECKDMDVSASLGPGTQCCRSALTRQRSLLEILGGLLHLRQTPFRSHAPTKRKSNTNTGSTRPISQPRQGAVSRPWPITNRDEEAEDGDTEGGTDGGKRKRHKKASSSSDSPPRLFACPYAKFDPVRYSELNFSEQRYRGCTSCFLTDISRLKQHLYRVHSRPEYYCGRCFETFDSDVALDSHTRQSIGCNLTNDCPFEEKLTESQIKQLKKKWSGKSPKECWYSIFKILFPDVALPISPYAEDGVSLAARGLLAQNVPQRLASDVRDRLLRSEHSPEMAQLLSAEDQNLLRLTIENALTDILRQTTLPSSSGSESRTLTEGDSSSAESLGRYDSHNIDVNSKPPTIQPQMSCLSSTANDIPNVVALDSGRMTFENDTAVWPFSVSQRQLGDATSHPTQLEHVEMTYQQEIRTNPPFLGDQQIWGGESNYADNNAFGSTFPHAQAEQTTHSKSPTTVGYQLPIANTLPNSLVPQALVHINPRQAFSSSMDPLPRKPVPSRNPGPPGSDQVSYKTVEPERSNRSNRSLRSLDSGYESMLTQGESSSSTTNLHTEDRSVLQNDMLLPGADQVLYSQKSQYDLLADEYGAPEYQNYGSHQQAGGISPGFFQLHMPGSLL